MQNLFYNKYLKLIIVIVFCINTFGQDNTVDDFYTIKSEGELPNHLTTLSYQKYILKTNN